MEMECCAPTYENFVKYANVKLKFEIEKNELI